MKPDKVEAAQQGTAELIQAARRKTISTPKIGRLLDSGANPTWEVLEALAGQPVDPTRLEVAKMFDSYSPGCWEAMTHYGALRPPYLHVMANWGSYPDWLPALADAGLVDIDLKSIHGTRPIHHAAIGRNYLAYGALLKAGAVDCPIELSRKELALLRMRGLWVPKSLGQTAERILKVFEEGEARKP